MACGDCTEQELEAIKEQLCSIVSAQDGCCGVLPPQEAITQIAKLMGIYAQLSMCTPAPSDKEPQIDVFGTPGEATWTVPEGAKSVEVLLVGGGGAGASGARQASNVDRFSGGGGGAGSVKLATFLASELPTGPIPLQVGAGATGAPVNSGTSVGCIAGIPAPGDTGRSWFGKTGGLVWLWALPGNSSSNENGGPAQPSSLSVAQQFLGAAGQGGSGTTTPTAPHPSTYGPGGGGASSRITAGGVITGNGSPGGSSVTTAYAGSVQIGHAVYAGIGNPGGAGGLVAGVVTGQPGLNQDLSALPRQLFGSGGGGGCPPLSISDNSGTGGNGGWPGGGGGGGGAGTNGQGTGGGGGNGGHGMVMITTYF